MNNEENLGVTKGGYFHNKNILVVSPEPWSHLFVSKHHYAIELAKHNRVYFLNPPSGKWSLQMTRFSNLWVINYPPFVKGLRFLPLFLQHQIMKAKFNKLQKLAKEQFDCIWSFDNSVFYDFKSLPSTLLTICHMVDHIQNFQFKKATSTASLCLGVSKNIVERMKPYNSHSFLMPHGVSISVANPKEVVLPGKNVLKVIYAGNLDSYLIDHDLLFQLIDRNSHIDFVCIGSGGARWIERANLYKLPPVPQEELNNYLQLADVLLITYNSAKYPEQLTNTHKLLEYLFAGKVVVSNFISDYVSRRHLLQMVDNSADFFSVFDDTVRNLSYYNQESKQLERKQFAIKNTYTRRLEEIEELITKNYHPKN